MAEQKKDRLANQIHLVNEGNQRSVSPENTTPVSNNRIEIGEYIADILVDKRSYPTVVHWIIQRRGNPEILQWGHEDDFDSASREAIAWVDSLLRYDDYRKNMKR